MYHILMMGEIIDFSVTPAPLCGRAATAGVVAIGFRITNLGNGPEAFVPGTPGVSGGSSFVVTGVFADSNGNGCYDAGIDEPIPAGRRTRSLAPGESIIVFVVGTGGNGTGQLTLPVTSETGTGVAGTAIPGAGNGGGAAVFGATGGAVTDIAAPLPGPLTASLAKTQSVRAPDGSAAPRAGAIITYRIEASFTGTGTASDVEIADTIPQGTSYVPGTMILDGVGVTDATDGDAGGFDGSTVKLPIGNVVAPAVHTITFQVRIK